jgi:hypothetical protein
MTDAAATSHATLNHTTPQHLNPTETPPSASLPTYGSPTLQTPMTTSIQFGVNNEVISDDIASHVRPSAMSDAAKANIGIQTRAGVLTTYQQATGAQQGNGTTRVQLRTPDGQVQIGGLRTDAATAENLKVMAPELFEAPEVKQAAAAKVADAAREEEITREDLNRHPGEIEGYHQHITGDVSPQSLISLMVYAQRGETPPASLISNIARDMGETVDNAVAKVNLVNQGVQAQFTVLARSMNLDADKAADWLRDHRKDSSMVALQAHYLRRDLQAWKPLLEDYQASTADGRAH